MEEASFFLWTNHDPKCVGMAELTPRALLSSQSGVQAQGHCWTALELPCWDGAECRALPGCTKPQTTGPGPVPIVLGKVHHLGRGRMELCGTRGKCFSGERQGWAGQGDGGRNGCSGSGQVHSPFCTGLNPHLAQDTDLTRESSSGAAREPQPGIDNRQVLGDIRALSPPLDMLRAGRAVTQRN